MLSSLMDLFAVLYTQSEKTTIVVFYFNYDDCGLELGSREYGTKKKYFDKRYSASIVTLLSHK